MLYDRKPYYVTGLAVGLLVVGFFLFGPKPRPEDRVAEHIAVLAQEPWDAVHVTAIEFKGPSTNPTDVFVSGRRPNGTPVLVQFAADSPYTSATAVHRVLETPPENRDAEILMVPRSLVFARFRDRFREDATHAGVAFYAGAPPTAEEAKVEFTPADTTAPSDS